MGIKATVLVVDDDADIRVLVRELLEGEGFEVREAEDGRAALRAFAENEPDVVVLDVSMPALSGWDVLDRVRELSDVPVLMLTARVTDEDKVRGLRGGADDYVTKPFSARELTARVAALLRRTRTLRRDDTYRDGFVSVDFLRRLVTVRGTDVALTPLEFRLLAAFVRHPDEVLSRERLRQLVWGDRAEASLDQVRLYVLYLRRKLASASDVSVPIETLRGFGYRYRPPAEGERL